MPPTEHNWNKSNFPSRIIGKLWSKVKLQIKATSLSSFSNLYGLHQLIEVPRRWSLFYTFPLNFHFWLRRQTRLDSFGLFSISHVSIINFSSNPNGWNWLAGELEVDVFRGSPPGNCSALPSPDVQSNSAFLWANLGWPRLIETTNHCYRPFD